MTRKRDQVEEPVDWLAEFAAEEPTSIRERQPLLNIGPRAGDRGPGNRAEWAEDGRRRPLLVLPPPPRYSISAPPSFPRPREESMAQIALLKILTVIGSIRSVGAWSHWPDRRIAIAGIAAIVIVIGVVATAAAMRRLGRDADVRDPKAAALLVRQAGSTPIGAPAAAPTVSPRPRATPARPTQREPAVPAVGERATESAPLQTEGKRPPPVKTKIDRQDAVPSPNAALSDGSALSAQQPPDVTPPVTLSADPPATTPTTIPTLTPTPTPTPIRTPSTPLAEADPPAPPPAPSDRTIQTTVISGVLERYRLAFSTLSVEGLAAIWRGANTKALARAFDQLETQKFEFDTCQIELYGEVAEASCGGRAMFVPKIGARTPRVETRHWTFHLVRAREGWIIDRIDSR